MSLYENCWVGENAKLRPVFRDEHAAGVPGADGRVEDWAPGAVIGVYVDGRDFPRALRGAPHLVDRTEFFDADGLQLGLPLERRRELSPTCRRALQSLLLAWRTWDERRWALFLERPEFFYSVAAQGEMIRSIVSPRAWNHTSV